MSVKNFTTCYQHLVGRVEERQVLSFLMGKGRKAVVLFLLKGKAVGGVSANITCFLKEPSVNLL